MSAFKPGFSRNALRDLRRQVDAPATGHAAEQWLDAAADFYTANGVSPQEGYRLAIADYDRLVRAGVWNGLPAEADEIVVGSLRAGDLEGAEPRGQSEDGARVEIAARSRQMRCVNPNCEKLNGGVAFPYCSDCFKKSLDPKGGVTPVVPIPNAPEISEHLARPPEAPSRAQGTRGGGGAGGGGGFGSQDPAELLGPQMPKGTIRRKIN